MRYFRMVGFLGVIFLLTSCGLLDNNDKENPEEYAYEGFSVVEPESNDFDLIAAHENGELFGMKESNDGIQSTTFRTNEGEIFYIEYGEDGLPKRSFINDFVLIFSNYSENSVDVAVITPSDEITIHRNLTIDQQILNSVLFKSSNLAKVKNNFITSEVRSTSKKMELMLAGVAIVGCVGGLALTAGSHGLAAPFAKVACVSTAVRTYAAFTHTDEENKSLNNSASAIGAIATAGSCGTAEVVGCTFGIVDLLGDGTTRAVRYIENKNDSVAGATGVLRFGGVWRSQSYSDYYFLVAKKYAADVDYYSSSSCYDFYYGEFISYSNNVFTYETEDGNKVDLKYELESNGDVLKGTRISDGAVFYFDKTDMEAANLIPECSFKNNLNNGISRKSSILVD